MPICYIYSTAHILSCIDRQMWHYIYLSLLPITTFLLRLVVPKHFFVFGSLSKPDGSKEANSERFRIIVSNRFVIFSTDWAPTLPVKWFLEIEWFFAARPQDTFFENTLSSSGLDAHCVIWGASIDVLVDPANTHFYTEFFWYNLARQIVIRMVRCLLRNRMLSFSFR